ncbi:MAG TPA: hypothetical protein VGH58_00930 [Solirubrobacterales bacterium]|jgi:hypothetical protein
MRGRIAFLCVAVLLLIPSSAQAFSFLPGTEGFSAGPLKEGGTPASQAGSHPTALKLSAGFSPSSAGTPFTEGDLRDLSFELPPGLFENPLAVPTCAQADFHAPRFSQFEASKSGESCQDKAQVGTLTVRSSYGAGQTRTFGLFNLDPPPGVPSEVGANPYGSPIIFIPQIRQAGGEYGITLVTKDVPQLTDVSALSLSLWGNPWSVLNDPQRGNCLNEAEPSFGWSKCSVGRPVLNPPTAYLTLPTSCGEALGFTARASSWKGPGTIERSLAAAALGGCESLAFEPKAVAQLSNPRASSASGYEFDLDVDSSGVLDPQRLAPSPIRKAVVKLPEGVTVNPSVGAGLGICAPAQFEAETPLSPPGAGCPNESKIGDFTVESPIIDKTIEGAIFLAAPHDNPFGSLIAVYLVAKSTDRGILVKVAGELKADQSTGTLTATFDRLPQLPYSSLRIHFREGQRSPLATPAFCGPISTEADLTPWRDPNLVVHASLPAQITAGVGGGPCPQGLAPFAPKAKGGTLNSQAGAYTPFYLQLTRQDQEQEITSYSATFPPGLLGKVAGVPYCPDKDIEAASHRSGIEERDHPSCPASSQIGRTSAGYGLGPVLTYAPGKLYLAGPYRGSQLSVVAIDSALVGPFDLGVVIIRSAVRIDPETAQASIDATGTDPIPHIIDGIPIHLKDVRAYIDRPNFTLNPTSCEPSAVSSALNGSGARFGDPSDDTLATATAPFQAFNCSALGFKPKVILHLKGGTKRSKHPALRVVVKPRPGDANIASAQVALPSSLFLDQAHIKTICTKGQFARHACPPESVYGHVKAYTPLLEEPMEGDAILRSSEHTLPDLVFALKGHGVEVDVAGKIDSVKGGLRGTFPTIPDAPVTKFELTMGAGKHGLLVVSARNLCAREQLADSKFMGHANRGWASHPEVRVKCGAKKAKTKKRSKHRRRAG